MKNKSLKIISTIISMFMIISFLTPTVKATTISTETSGETVVSYGMDESFIVTIPSRLRISYESDTGEMDISASNVMIGDGKVLEVTISSENYNNRWELEYTRTPYTRLTYRIGTTEYGRDIVNNSVVLSVAAGEAYNSTVTQTLYVYVSETLRYSGTYKDYLTFTVSIN